MGRAVGPSWVRIALADCFTDVGGRCVGLGWKPVELWGGVGWVAGPSAALRMTGFGVGGDGRGRFARTPRIPTHRKGAMNGHPAPLLWIAVWIWGWKPGELWGCVGWAAGPSAALRFAQDDRGLGWVEMGGGGSRVPARIPTHRIVRDEWGTRLLNLEHAPSPSPAPGTRHPAPSRAPGSRTWHTHPHGHTHLSGLPHTEQAPSQAPGTRHTAPSRAHGTVTGIGNTNPASSRAYGARGVCVIG